MSASMSMSSTSNSDAIGLPHGVSRAIPDCGCTGDGCDDPTVSNRFCDVIGMSLVWRVTIEWRRVPAAALLNGVGQLVGD